MQQRVKVRVLRHIRNEDSHLGAKPRASLRRRPWAPDLTLLPSAHTCPCPAPGKGERGSSPRVLSVGPRAGRQPPGRRSCKVPHLVLPGGAQGWAMARGSVPGPRDYPLPGSRTTAGQAEESRPGTAAGPAAPQLVGTAGRTPRGGSPGAHTWERAGGAVGALGPVTRGVACFLVTALTHEGGHLAGNRRVTRAVLAGGRGLPAARGSVTGRCHRGAAGSSGG